MKRANNGLRLNLGSGPIKLKGFLNVDKLDLSATDFVWNLEKLPLPFETSSVSEIICDHVLEHIANFIPLMEEMHRVCKPHAIVRISVPYYKYEGAFRDPTHVRFFSERSFEYFTDQYTYNYFTKARFKVRKRELKTRYKSNGKSFLKKVMLCIPLKSILNPFFWNIYSEIYFELEVLK